MHGRPLDMLLNSASAMVGPQKQQQHNRVRRLSQQLHGCALKLLSCGEMVQETAQPGGISQVRLLGLHAVCDVLLGQVWPQYTAQLLHQASVVTKCMLCRTSHPYQQQRHAPAHTLKLTDYAALAWFKRSSWFTQATL